MVELVVAGFGAEPEVAVDLGVDEQIPDLPAEGGQLGRVHGLGLGVGVEQLLEAGQLVVGLGPGHRWQEMIDDHGVGSALGLGPLARDR